MKTFKYILTIGIATGVGAVLGILTAPRSGRRTRARLMDDFEESRLALSDAANKKLKEAKKIVNDSMERHIDHGKQLLNKGKELIS